MILIFISIFLTVLSQVIFKIASREKKYTHNIVGMYFSLKIILAYILLLAVTIINYYILQQAHITIMLVIFSSNFIGVILMSVLILKEKIGVTKYIGMFIIITGVILYMTNKGFI
jgi:drug/metabolite transporter (DMT)-like permease